MSRCRAVVAPVGAAGWIGLDDLAFPAAHSGPARHLRIGAGARVGAQAGVTEAGMAGSPAQPLRGSFHAAALCRLARKPNTTAARPE